PCRCVPRSPFPTPPTRLGPDATRCSRRSDGRRSARGSCAARCRGCRSSLLGGPFAFRFLFHLLETFVVVRKLLHVRQCNLAGDDRVVSGDVRLRVVSAVLELDVHAVPELLEVEAVPVDTDRVSDASCLLSRRSASLGHDLSSPGSR